MSHKLWFLLNSKTKNKRWLKKVLPINENRPLIIRDRRNLCRLQTYQCRWFSWNTSVFPNRKSILLKCIVCILSRRKRRQKNLKTFYRPCFFTDMQSNSRIKSDVLKNYECKSPFSYWHKTKRYCLKREMERRTRGLRALELLEHPASSFFTLFKPMKPFYPVFL